MTKQNKVNYARPDDIGENRWREIVSYTYNTNDNRCFRCYGKKVIHLYRIPDEVDRPYKYLITLCDDCHDYIERHDLTTRRDIDSYGYEPSTRAGTPQQIRIEMMKENGGSHTAKQFEDLCEKYGNKCINPDCKNPYASLTADHVIPITWEGSTNYIENIQPLCKSCNSSKGNRSAADYRSASSLVTNDTGIR